MRRQPGNSHGRSHKCLLWGERCGNMDAADSRRDGKGTGLVKDNGRSAMTGFESIGVTYEKTETRRVAESDSGSNGDGKPKRTGASHHKHACKERGKKEWMQGEENTSNVKRMAETH